jgi:hypothetical protein
VRFILSCALLPLLGGCASGEWVKSSGELAGEPVLAQCSQQAWARSRHEQMTGASAPVPGSVMQTTKSGQITTTTSITPGSTPFPQADVQEQTFFNLCMKELGYDYVPITPGSFH